MFISKAPHMSTVYRISIDTKDAPQHPIVYTRKVRACKTVKGAERQMERITNEVLADWKQYESQIRRYTIELV
jgi:hypothetical protein